MRIPVPFMTIPDPNAVFNVVVVLTIFPNLSTTLTPDLFASLGCGQQYRNFKNEDE